MKGCGFFSVITAKMSSVAFQSGHSFLRTSTWWTSAFLLHILLSKVAIQIS